MPFICGCSKNYEQTIVGDWFLCYQEESMHCNIPSCNTSDQSEYTKKTSTMVASFSEDGKFTFSYKDGEVLPSGTGLWSLDEDKLILQYDDHHGYYTAETYNVVFNGKNKFYMSMTEQAETGVEDVEAFYYCKLGWQRL